jgi:hypothetical protein
MLAAVILNPWFHLARSRSGTPEGAAPALEPVELAAALSTHSNNIGSSGGAACLANMLVKWMALSNRGLLISSLLLVVAALWSNPYFKLLLPGLAATGRISTTNSAHISLQRSCMYVHDYRQRVALFWAPLLSSYRRGSPTAGRFCHAHTMRRPQEREGLQPGAAACPSKVSSASFQLTLSAGKSSVVVRAIHLHRHVLECKRAVTSAPAQHSKINQASNAL